MVSSTKISAQKIWIHPDDRMIIEYAFEDLCESGEFAYGKNVKKFEERFAKYVGRKYAVAVGAGGHALEIACRALKLNLVIVPTNTFFASAIAIEHAHGIPLLCDVDDELNATVYTIAERYREVSHIGVSPDGLMMVYIGGNMPIDMDLIQEYCEEHNMNLVVDAAHCVGTTDSAKYGQICCYSFYPTKVMTTCNEGGMLVTDDRNIYEFAKSYRDYGRSPTNPQKHLQAGQNYRMSELDAIIGLTQLRRMPEYLRTRRRVAKIYSEKFQILGDLQCSNFYKVITFDQLQIPTNIHMAGKVYEIPLHKQPYYKHLNLSFPKADKYCAAHSCLPIWNTQTDEEAQYVVDNIKVVE